MIRRHPHHAALKIADWARELTKPCDDFCTPSALFRGPDILERLDRNIADCVNDASQRSLLSHLRNWAFGAIGCIDGTNSQTDIDAMCSGAVAFVRERIFNLAHLTPALLTRAGAEAQAYAFADTVIALQQEDREQDDLFVVKAIHSLPDLERFKDATIYWMLTTVTWSRHCQEHLRPLVERLSKEWHLRQHSTMG